MFHSQSQLYIVYKDIQYLSSNLHLSPILLLCYYKVLFMLPPSCIELLKLQLLHHIINLFIFSCFLRVFLDNCYKDLQVMKHNSLYYLRGIKDLDYTIYPIIHWQSNVQALTNCIWHVSYFFSYLQECQKQIIWIICLHYTLYHLHIFREYFHILLFAQLSILFFLEAQVLSKFYLKKISHLQLELI